jgi:hypothetical protein
MIQINDKGIMGRVANIRINQLQTLFWLQKSPLKEWNIKFSSKLNNNLIGATLAILKDTPLKINTNQYKANIIQGGNITIYEILGEHFFDHIVQLRNQGIIFLEQLTSQDGTRLLNWKDLKNKTYTSRISKIPKWFKLVEEVTLNNPNLSRKVKENLITSNEDFKGSIISDIDITTNKKNEFIAIWDTINKITCTGRIIDKNPFNNTIILEHWIHKIEKRDVSPSINEPVLQKCSGCIINNDKFNQIMGKKYLCTSQHKAELAIKIDKPSRIIDNMTNINVSIFEISQQAKKYYNYLDNYSNINGNNIIQESTQETINSKIIKKNNFTKKLSK